MKKTDESDFKVLLKESITSQFGKFEYFRNICRKKRLSISDIIKAIDNEEYYRIPSVSASAFKKSKGLFKEINDLSQRGKFQVSSSTSGDPSFVYTNMAELDKIADNYRLTFGIDGVSKAIGFSPSYRILDALSKRTEFMGYKCVSRMKIALDATKTQYKNPTFSLDVDLLRTLLSKAIKGKAVLKKKNLSEISEIITTAEKNNDKISLGGFVLLFYPYLVQMKEGQFNLGKNAYFPFSGGGYCGSKGAIKGEKVDKSEMIKRISSVFGLDKITLSANVKDIYAFTESSATNEGFWCDEIDDYLFETWHESRIYIVDPETELPLRSGVGQIKVIAPYSNGNPSAANVSVLQEDNATIRRCLLNYSVTEFSHITRSKSASIEGCAYKAEKISGA